MSSPWLLLDVSYLAYRAYFSMGKLSHGQIPTGVVYGVIKEIIQLQETFNTKKLAFCFDHGKPARSYVCPGYKANRRENKSEEELEAILIIKEQIKLLRKEYLPQVGFRNLFWQKGYEADDVIAKIVKDRPTKEFIIVSSDQDLYQLLGKFVSVWNPHKKERITEESFRKSYGVGPITWIDVKAMAGCSSDNIKGIPGVGEKTALKFICGELSSGKVFDKIAFGSSIWKANVSLVTIPYPGISSFRLVKDEVTPDGWQGLIDRLGFNSLVGSIPGIPRRSSTDDNSFTRASLGVFKNKGKKNG